MRLAIIAMALALGACTTVRSGGDGAAFGFGGTAYPVSIGATSKSKINECRNTGKVDFKCAKANADDKHGWFRQESDRLQQVMTNLSWTTGVGTSVLVFGEGRGGDTTTRGWGFLSLAPVIYDDVTAVRYRKQVADNAAETVSWISGRYEDLEDSYWDLSDALDKVPSATDIDRCALISNDIAALTLLKKTAEVQLVLQELTALADTCVALDVLQANLIATKLTIGESGTLALKYLADTESASGDFRDAMSDTLSSPTETFQIVAAAPFSAASKAIKGGSPLEAYSSKRARSPDVFDFVFYRFPLTDTTAPLPPAPSWSGGLSPAGRAAIDQIAGLKTLKDAKLTPIRVFEMQVHAGAVAGQMVNRRGRLEEARGAAERLRLANNANRRSVDLRPKPVQGAKPATEPEKKASDPAK